MFSATSTPDFGPQPPAVRRGGGSSAAHARNGHSAAALTAKARTARPPPSQVEQQLMGPLLSLETCFGDVSRSLLHAESTRGAKSASPQSTEAKKTDILTGVEALRKAAEACEAALQESLVRLRGRVTALSEDNSALASRHPQLVSAISSWASSCRNGDGAGSLRTPSLLAQQPPPNSVSSPAGSAPTVALEAVPSSPERRPLPAGDESASIVADGTPPLHRGANGAAGSSSTQGRSLDNTPRAPVAAPTAFSTPCGVGPGQVKGGGSSAMPPHRGSGATTSPPSPEASAIGVSPTITFAADRHAVRDAAAAADARVGELLTGGGASPEVRRYLHQFVDWRRSRPRLPRRRHRAASASRLSTGGKESSLNRSPWRSPAVPHPHPRQRAGGSLTSGSGNGSTPQPPDHVAEDDGASCFLTSTGARRPAANGLSTRGADRRSPAAPATARASAHTDGDSSGATGGARPSLRSTVDAMLLRQLQYDGVALPPDLKEDLSPGASQGCDAVGCVQEQQDVPVACLFEEIRQGVFHPTPCPRETLTAASASRGQPNEEEGHGGHGEGASPIGALLQHTFPATAAWLDELVAVGHRARATWRASMNSFREARYRNARGGSKRHSSGGERAGLAADSAGRGRGGNEKDCGEKASSPATNAETPPVRTPERSRSGAYSMITEMIGALGDASLELAHGEVAHENEEEEADEVQEDLSDGDAVVVVRRPRRVASGEEIEEEEDARVASDEEVGEEAYWEVNATPPAFRSSPHEAFFESLVGDEEDEELDESEEGEPRDGSYPSAAFTGGEEEVSLEADDDEEEEADEGEEEDGEEEERAVRNAELATVALAKVAALVGRKRRPRRPDPRGKVAEGVVLRCQIGVRAKALLRDLALLCVLQEITFAVERAREATGPSASASSSSSSSSSPTSAFPPSAAALHLLQDAMRLVHLVTVDPLTMHRDGDSEAGELADSVGSVLLSFHHVLTATGYLPLLGYAAGGGSGGGAAAQDFVACVAPYLTLWGAHAVASAWPSSDVSSDANAAQRIFPSGSGEGGAAAGPASTSTLMASPLLSASRRAPSARGAAVDPLPLPPTLAPVVWQESLCQSLAQQVHRLNQQMGLLPQLEGSRASKSVAAWQTSANETLGQWKDRVCGGGGAAAGQYQPPLLVAPENALARFVFPISEVLLRELGLWRDGGMLPTPQAAFSRSSSSESVSDTAERQNDPGSGGGGDFTLPPAEVAGRRGDTARQHEDEDEDGDTAPVAHVLVPPPGQAPVSPPAPHVESATTRRGLWQALMPWTRGTRASDGSGGGRAAPTLTGPGVGTRAAWAAGTSSPTDGHGGEGNNVKPVTPATSAAGSANALVLDLPHAAAILSECDRALERSGQVDFFRRWPLPRLSDFAAHCDDEDDADDARVLGHAIECASTGKVEKVDSAVLESHLPRAASRKTPGDSLFSADPCLTSTPVKGTAVASLPAFRTTMCYCLVSRRRCLDPLVSGALLRRFTADGKPVAAPPAAASQASGGPSRSAGSGVHSAPPVGSLRHLSPAERERRMADMVDMTALSLFGGTPESVEAIRAHYLRLSAIPGTAPPARERAAAPSIYAQSSRNLHGTSRAVAERREPGPASATGAVTAGSRGRRHQSRHGSAPHATSRDLSSPSSTDDRSEEDTGVAHRSVGEPGTSTAAGEGIAEAEEDFMARYVPTTRLLTPNLYDTPSTSRSARLNPPDLLSCGHVVSHKELQRLVSAAAARRGRGAAAAPPVQSVRCPYCQSDCLLSAVVTLSYVF